MNQVKFDKISHSYVKVSNGKKLSSVTQILSTSGLVDSSFYSSGTTYLDRGTMLHEATAKMDAGEKVDLRKIPKKYRGFLDAWKLFRKETGFTPTLIEHAVAHLKETCTQCGIVHEYSGTLDRLGYFTLKDKLITILDLKNHNSGRVGDWVRFQLVGYGHALCAGKMYNRVGVALHPDGTYKMTTFKISTWMQDLETFLQAANATARTGAWMKFRGV